LHEQIRETNKIYLTLLTGGDALESRGMVKRERERKELAIASLNNYIANTATGRMESGGGETKGQDLRGTEEVLLSCT